MTVSPRRHVPASVSARSVTGYPYAALSSIRSLLQMFDTVVSRLRDERLSVAIFPEGTSHSGPHVLELKVRAVSYVFLCSLPPAAPPSVRQSFEERSRTSVVRLFALVNSKLTN